MRCASCQAENPDGAAFCGSCGRPLTQPMPTVGQGSPQAMGPDSRWYRNSYHIRKKILAIADQYWIEDQVGSVLGYSKQKLLRIKEDVRIYTDEQMNQELFRIKQEGIIDAWGTFAVIDSSTNAPLGYVRRKALASTIRAEWEVYDASRQLIGGVHESTGRALARRLIPGGKLIPEKVTLELQGRPVAQINQEFKVIGDVWDIFVQDMSPAFDRRVLVSCALLMGMIEKELERK